MFCPCAFQTCINLWVPMKFQIHIQLPYNGMLLNTAGCTLRWPGDDCSYQRKLAATHFFLKEKLALTRQPVIMM